MRSKLTFILIRSLFLLLPILLSNEVFSQRIEPNRWFIKADGGVSVFFGDVKRYDYVPDHESPSEIQPMFGASLGKEISKIFSVRGQFLYGRLNGHKKRARYNFQSTVMSGHLLTDINLMYLFTGARFGESRLNIYSSLGVGYSSWDTKLYYDNPPSNGSDIMAESKMGALSFPAALSLEYVFNRHLSVNMEGMIYVVTSDEVDAKSGGISVDMINYNSIGITYKFGIKTKARKSKINYELDPSLYEARPGDPQYREDEYVEDVTPVFEEEVVPVIILVDNDEEQTPEEKQRQDSKENAIDHELENAAIQKEIWAKKSDNLWAGVEFSVQVLSTRKSIDLRYFKDKYDIAQDIVENHEGGWYKYSVGKYDRLWRARELRNKLRSNTGIKDAFIVAYKDGTRISLEEALGYEEKAKSASEERYRLEQEARKLYPAIVLEDNIPSHGIVIGVQLLAFQGNNKYPIGMLKGVYGIDKPILINFDSPWYKIIVGGFDTYQQAYDYQFEARNKGFVDAYVVAHKDGVRISLDQLKEELNK